MIGQDYQAGYDDGLQEGEQRGWEKGKEAAAAYHDEQAREWREEAGRGDEAEQAMLNYAAAHKDDAAAIRKLKKP